ncbi:12305_t:CDS:2 [Funneliformis caledonium]|uniref:12305_t:CDS:1 n=1 Tax=Funneliformis caledonium TaxID=1117310 RepID=A0A9N9DB36_9GLOM|nr:12305_t:CDS:2 [Funneliformis caledonium]
MIPLRKGTWTNNEQIRFDGLIVKYGRDWAKIARELGRSAPDCRNRYKSLNGLNNFHRCGLSIRTQQPSN